MANVVIGLAQFDTRTTNGTLDITDSALGGLTPKAALIVCSRHASANNPNSTVNAIASIGFTDGTRQFCCATYSAHNVANTDVGRDQATDRVLQLHNSTTVLQAASFSAWITNGIRLSFTPTEGFTDHGYVILFAGDVQAHCNTKNLGTGTSAISVTGVGFTPSLVFLANSGAANGSGIEAFAQINFGIAANDGSDTQKSYGISEGDAVVGGNASSTIRSNRGLVSTGVGSATEAYNVLVSSFVSGGFSITPNVNAASDDLGFLALDLGDVGFKLFDVSPTATGNRSYTEPAFKPQFVLWVGSGHELRDNPLFDVNNAGGFSIGALSVNGTYIHHSFRSDATVSPTVCVNQCNTTTPIRCITGLNTATPASGADFVSWDALGFTLNWTTAATPAKMGFALAIQQVQILEPSLVPSDDAFFTPKINQKLYGPGGNLLKYSQDFTNAAWTKGASVSIGSTNNPDPFGGSNASKIQESNTTVASHPIIQTPLTLLDNTPYWVGARLKAVERTFGMVSVFDKAGNFHARNFNLSTGALGSSLSGSPQSASATSLGSGWYYCGFWFNSGAGATTPEYYINIQQSDGVNSYAGTVGSGILCIGAQMDVGIVPPDYVLTTSAAALTPPDDAFFTHVATRAAQLLTPAVNADDAFFTQIIKGAQQLTPSLYTDNDAFFTPVVSFGVTVLQPSLFVEHDYIYGGYTGAGLNTIVTHKTGLIHLVELDIFQRLATSTVVQWIWPFGYYGFSTLPQEDLPDSGVQTLRYSDVGYKTPGIGTYPNTLFPGQVEQPLRMSRSIPVVPEMARRVNLELGAIEIINEEGEFDEMPVQYAIDGRQVQVKIGLGESYDHFSPIFIGRAVSWTATISTLFVEVRDQTYQLDKPLQLTLYAGTGGAEGTAENEGKPKPRCFGHVQNITPVLIDPANLVFQFHDRAAQFVNEVYDQGANLTRTGNDYASYAALVAATIAAGKFATCLAFGMFRLGSSPAGLITCDVKGDAAGGYIDVPGDIAKRIMKDFGTLSDSDFDATSWAAFTADVVGSIGVYFPDPILISDAVSVIMSGCAAWWGASINGKFQAQRLQEPDQDNVTKAFYEYDVIEFERVQPPSGAFPPRHRQRVGYRRNWTLQRGEDIAGSVSDDRRQFLRDEYRVVSTFDDNVRQDYFLSTNPEMLGSLFTGEDNRLLYSQDYTQSVWTKEFVTVFNTAISAPDGTATATELRETAVTDFHSLGYSFVPAYLSMENTDFTVSILVKKATGARDWCKLYGISKAGVGAYQSLNLNTGALGASLNAGNAQAIDEGNGWYRLSFWFNSGTGGTTPRIAIYLGTADGAPASYAGSTAQGIYVWGAQVEIGREMTNYWKTTDTRSVSARVHSEELSADLMTLLKVVRETVRITVDLEGHLATVGSTVQLTHQRVNAGQLWLSRVIDMTINSAERTVDLVLWG